MRTVLCAEGLYEPTVGLIEYLKRYPATRHDPVRILFGTRRTAVPPEVKNYRHVHLAGVMPGRGLRGLDLEYVRGGYSDVCSWLRTGALELDAVVAVGAIGTAGNVDLGVINGYLQPALDAARVLIIEAADFLPMVKGAASTARQADIIVKAPSADGFIPLVSSPDECTEAIAERVAELCELVGSLSLGVGRVAAALAERITPAAPLRIVAGAIDDSVLRLVERGVVSTRDPIVAMSVVGSPAVTSWASSDPRVYLRPSEVVHNSEWLARMDGLTTVLGALQVDRAGNVNAERISGQWISGLGGALDFAKGARAARGGLCVVALPSTSPNGASTLVESVDQVTVPARFVDVIVTEHGVAFSPGELPRIFPERSRR